MNVMISIDEFVQRLEERIQKYRQTQKGAWRIRGFLRVIKQEILEESRYMSRDIQRYLQTLKEESIERINELHRFSQKQLDKQRLIYEEQSSQLKQQIAHQYKIINHLKKEMEDLMDMLNHQAVASMKTVQNPNKRQNQHSEQNQQYEDRNQTINGLEVIEEEETQRTVMSSVNSFNEDGHFAAPDYFIRIQEKQKSQYENQNNNQDHLETQNQNEDWRQNKHLTSNSEDQQWPSNCKFQGLLQSEVSSRHQTFQMEPQSQDVIENWESLPVSVQQGMQRGEGPWSGGNLPKQLREITNQSQHQRQKKTKMFLEQFRKTFNKCLSTNVSRKNSKKDMSKPPKDKNRSLGATFGKIQIERPSQNKQSDNQKMINDMLRDIDNNNKFSVGGRRSQLKYEGQKKDGGRSGSGILYYSNGLCYEGEFKHNLRHGFGVLRFNQIQIYRGQWSGDQLSGQGKLRNFAVINKKKSQNSTSPLNRWVSYCGYFKGNRFEGEGTLYLQGGQKFLGKFICGCACGEGTLYRKNGEVETGVWRHNQMVQQF